MDEFVPIKNSQEEFQGIINNQIYDEYPDGVLFYPNLRFSKRDLTFTIGSACSEKRGQDAREAFSVLDNNTILRFNELELNGDIEVTCSELSRSPDEDYFIAGEGGPSAIINTSKYYVILNGTILFYRDNKCDEPIVALHEILHVLGFKHSSNPKSIMYNVSSCEQRLTNEIIEVINEVYQDPTLPDLTVLNPIAKKKGIYLDFYIEVFNAGLDYSSESFVSIYADKKEIAKYDLGELNVGAGKSVNVTNLRVIWPFTELSFVADPNERMFEIDEKNNEIKLVVQ